MLKNMIQSLGGGAACLLLVGCANNPMLGEWQYQHEATSIGLELKKDDECMLTLDRFVKKNLKKSCRFEPNKHPSDGAVGESYLIFMRDDKGHCDVFADFEFLYEQEAGLVTFLVGETPFHMQKIK